MLGLFTALTSRKSERQQNQTENGETIKFQQLWNHSRKSERQQNQTENGETIKFQQIWNHSTTKLWTEIWTLSSMAIISRESNIFHEMRIEQWWKDHKIWKKNYKSWSIIQEQNDHKCRFFFCKCKFNQQVTSFTLHMVNFLL